MIGVIVLALRLLLVLALYAFLGWTIWTIAQDVKRAGAQATPRRIPIIRLEVQTGDGNVVTRAFSQPEITLGRDPTCDILLNEETVSARHAKLSYHHNQWWIEDLNSTNGTNLNEMKVNTATVLTSGDEIHCGKARLIVSLGGDAIVPITQKL
jgi:pSer/pThr/pTyr-binding forkhead associated (FHA) protein